MDALEQKITNAVYEKLNDGTVERIRSLMAAWQKQGVLLSVMSAVKNTIYRIHTKHIRELRRRIWSMKKRLILILILI